MTEAAVLAVRDLIVGMFPDPIPPRCGISVCGGTRLGIGSLWPIDTLTIPARCGLARCGASYVGRIIANNAIFAGMLPVMYSHHVTIGLTELQGGEADPRQHYDEAYDNPGVMVRIVGDDMVTLDRVADAIRRQLDGGHHLTTAHGTINGMTAAPPVRMVRGDRPRYEVDITIEAEFIRPDNIEAVL